jgi:hypothetical protein
VEAKARESRHSVEGPLQLGPLFATLEKEQAPRAWRALDIAPQNVHCVVKLDVPDCNRQEGEASIPDAPN